MNAPAPAPLLTIGMAHHNDWAGVWSTIQGIRLNNLELMRETEFVVINNSPETTGTAEAIRNLLAKCATQGVPAKYVELTTKGTSPARNAIFQHATGTYVAAMDCHLQFHPQSFRLLMEYYRAHPDTRDLLSGPLIDDTLASFSTHFRDTWDDGMWGQWAQAWQCQCSPQGSYFDLERVEFESGTVLAMPRRLQLGNIPLNHCEACGKSIPDVSWNQHEQTYLKRGFVPVGINPGPAFEIPGQGLGFFSCRRDAWLGFNEHARAFGAEELSIHELYRQKGHKSLCLPGVFWNHNFYKERHGVPGYPNTNYDKARNYVLWRRQLGMPVDDIHAHFVTTPIRRHLQENPPRTLFFITPSAWDALMEDPINNVEDPGPRKLAAEQAAAILPHLTTIEDLFAEIEPLPRDLNEHMAAFKVLTESAGGTVVELTGRRESTIAFLAGRPDRLYSFTTEIDNHVLKAAHLVADKTKFTSRPFQPGSVIDNIPENDLLFVDTKHTYAHLKAELAAYGPRCRRYIVLHDTEVFGMKGEDGQLGLRFAIAEFCDSHPEWAVVDHTTQQHGLTVLSRRIEDRPETPVEGFNVPRGPGTELKKILTSLGIAPSASCSCNGRAAQMDIWGADGCEQPDNFQTIVGWLKTGTWSGLDLAGAVAKSFFTGIAWEINPLSPFDSLVKLCIKRARETEAKREKKEEKP